MNRLKSNRFLSVKGGGLLHTGQQAASPAASTSKTTLDHPASSSSAGFVDLTGSDDDEADFEEVAPNPFKKRKTAAPPPSQPTPSPARARAKPKAKAKPKTKPAPIQSTVDWPPHFKKLEQVFKAINTVYTFASARKSLATTFEVLRGSVERLLGRPLEPHDIAQLKALLPDLITFAYTDSDELIVHAPSLPADSAKAKRLEHQRQLDAEYEAVALGRSVLDGEIAAGERGKGKKKEQVLLFRFDDGELKIGPKYRSGKHFAYQPKQTKSPHELMSNQIAARNAKFNLAVSELLLACAAHNPPHDPVELLLEATNEHVPLKAGLEGTEPGKGATERREDFEFYRTNPDRRPTIARIIEEMKEGEEYVDQIVEGGHRVVEARDAQYGELETDLSKELWAALYALKSITKLYSHQAAAINHLDNGHNVIVSTSTSSGKSLIYQIPVLKALEADPEATALYIFPTKALAQDQRRSLAELMGHHDGLYNCRVETFDGDTPRQDRDSIRENASVIFANHDILHMTILPREDEWRRFFRNLRFVVVDELHYYGGLFGAHVAFVMRRLRRICRAIGNDQVRFISCSATIANPVEHMQALFGVEDVVLVDEDGSPSGRKEHIVWNPRLNDQEDPRQGRVSTITETSRIFRFLMDRGVRCIVFCKVRIFCELLMKQVRADLMQEGRSEVAQRVMAYRSGYSAADRRQIERDMFSGQLLGIVSTTALELGVDIGSLDAVLTVSFPYTLPGLRQQAGRAGRRQKDSLSMLVCGPFPLDQHFARNPDELWTSPFSKVTFDLGNPIVLEGHVQCAAKEMPIEEGDVQYFGEDLKRICAEQLVADDEGFWHASPSWGFNPAKLVSLRASEEGNYTVVDVTGGKSEVLEELETSRAIFTAYEGAIYHHQARTFVVKRLDHDNKVAHVQRATLNYQTRARDFTNIDPVDTLAIREIEGSPFTASYGTIKIESVIFGYYKVDRKNNILDTVDVYAPSYVRQSHGMWVDVPSRALEILMSKGFHLAGAIHAAEHAILSLSPVVAMSTEGDIKTECKQPEKELSMKATSRKRPARLILYDAAGLSSGVCGRAFEHFSTLLSTAADTIAACPCEEGCPMCVSSHLCSGANTIISKLGALIILYVLLDRHIDVDSIEMQEPLEGAARGPPGGTVALGGLNKAKKGPGGWVRQGLGAGGEREEARQAVLMARGVMEEEEMGEDEEAERERMLAELMGGTVAGGGGTTHGEVPEEEVRLSVEEEIAEAEVMGVRTGRSRADEGVVWRVEDGGGFEGA